jgi:hypothetical protein
MRICDKCLAEEINGKCRLCGKSKLLRDAEFNDNVYVGSADFIFSRMIEDAFDEANIKYLRKGTLGSAITFTIGSTNETYLYYVMLNDFEKAKEIIESLPLDISDEELESYIDGVEE